MDAVHLELEPAPASRVSPLPRVDLYGGVHRGLRLAHGDVLDRLATMSYDDRVGAELVLEELENTLDLARAHLTLEERHYHPALEARKPGASRRLDEQHRGHAAAFSELRALAARLSAAGPDTVQAVGRALYLRYACFVADDLAHMAEEELVTLPLFHALYSEQELYDLQAALVQDIAPRERAEFFRLIVLASDHASRVTMLTRVRAELSEPAFARMLDSLRGRLPEAEQSRLVSAL